ncbi:PPE domain-containing protein [Allokutzneria sp. NRRL B-24872]|uniref:PPE domain-containing protein n=1 Tax=Allokutzneria sp. NRRL B-24872 TaxID=1137961 RepID=UPI00143D3F97|nr:PPE domain-containing protein [Allokutzneria sp. NRRL B-24872]
MTGINWLAVPHEELHRQIRSGRGVASARSAEAFYRNLRKQYEDAVFDLAEGLKSLGAAWDGLAAGRARSSIGRFGPWAELAGTNASSCTNSTVMQSWHYTQARDRMPEPRAVTAMPDNGVIQGIANFFGITTDRQLQEKAAHEAHLRAAEVMRSYAQNSTQTGTSFPAFAPPPQVSLTVPGAPSPAPRPPISGPRGGQLGTATASEQHGVVEQQGFQPTSTDSTAQPPPTHRDGGGHAPVTTGGVAGWSSGGTSGFARGGQANISQANNSQQGGNRLGGGTGKTGPAAPTPTAAQAGRGATGKPGQQSFMQPALGSTQQQQEEEAEHARKYSVTDDLVGDLPQVAPPVIGE